MYLSCKILFADVRKRNAQLAQLVEQRTENPRVSGSIPELGIFYGALAQSVEHLTFNQVVRGSNPRCFTMWNPFEGSFFCSAYPKLVHRTNFDYVYLKVTAKILQKSRKCTML